MDGGKRDTYIPSIGARVGRWSSFGGRRARCRDMDVFTRSHGARNGICQRTLRTTVLTIIPSPTPWISARCVIVEHSRLNRCWDSYQTITKRFLHRTLPQRRSPLETTPLQHPSSRSGSASDFPVSEFVSIVVRLRVPPSVAKGVLESCRCRPMLRSTAPVADRR